MWWSTSDLPCRQPGQVPSLHRADPGCREGPVQSEQLPSAQRALKTRGNTPKYGFIFHSTFIGRAAAENKGRISRYLASKCTIASRIDAFSEVPTCVFGDKLRDQVEERLSFYKTGEEPRKNLDVMKRGCDTGRREIGERGEET